MKQFAKASDIRSKFSKAMSEMYRLEVPLYGDLISINKEVNANYFTKHPTIEQEIGKLDRISEERHGAIRLGTEKELATMARFFAVMAMYPVGYYDLSIRNLPVHSTAFRPIEKEELAINPFRIFTSLLRLDLLEEPLQSKAREILDQRQIFTDPLLALLNQIDKDGGLDETSLDCFIDEALFTFKWQDTANVTKELYEELLSLNSLVADIVGFRNPHINHLTPRSLDIDTLHTTMESRDINMIDTIQGPPKRSTEILLRQTSFRALNEKTQFPNLDGGYTEGQHRARFGEIEQRGCALTPKGRALYDQLLDQVNKEADILKENHALQSNSYPQILKKVFAAFPDRWEDLRKEKLAYFTYIPTGKSFIKPPTSHITLEWLIGEGYITTIPITYEDFLPVSAAGIFASNLDDKSGSITVSHSNQAAFVKILGSELLDPFILYQREEDQSIRECLTQLSLNVDDIKR